MDYYENDLVDVLLLLYDYCEFSNENDPVLFSIQTY